MYCLGRLGLFLQIRPTTVKKSLADGYCHRQRQEGTLIHNGIARRHNGIAIAARNTRFFTLSPDTLSVVPVKSRFGCLVVAEVGSFQLTIARDSAATVTAIALPVITTAADVEIPAAFRKPTNQLNQYNFGVLAHISPEGGTGQTPRFMSALYPLVKVQNLNSLRGSFGHRALARLVPSSLLPSL
jgi:hypothetical protein